MPPTRIRQIYPTAELPGLLAQSGRTPEQGVPLRWLETLVSRVRSHILKTGGTESEADSVLVFGAEHLTARYTDELTALEQLQDQVSAQSETLAALRTLLGRAGEAMTIEQLDAVRQALRES